LVGPALTSALLSREISRALSCLGEFELCLGMHGDGSEKAEQFTAKRCHNLVLILAASGERLVAFV
jgi:hypothetical protein